MSFRQPSLRLVELERRLCPYYPAFAVFGILCCIANLTLNEGASRLVAVVWVVVVPLWISRYLACRRGR